MDQIVLNIFKNKIIVSNGFVSLKELTLEEYKIIEEWIKNDE